MVAVQNPYISLAGDVLATDRVVNQQAGLVVLVGHSPGGTMTQYRAENVRIEQVFGPAALAVSPRIGPIHVTMNNTPWHWLDASGEPLTITGLPAGPHTVLIELVNAAHQTLDYGVVSFEIPQRTLTPNDPKADGFRAAPNLAPLRY